jgi:hypothetical protein
MKIPGPIRKRVDNRMILMADSRCLFRSETGFMANSINYILDPGKKIHYIFIGFRVNEIKFIVILDKTTQMML